MKVKCRSRWFNGTACWGESKHKRRQVLWNRYDKYPEKILIGISPHVGLAEGEQWIKYDLLSEETIATADITFGMGYKRKFNFSIELDGWWKLDRSFTGCPEEIRMLGDAYIGSAPRRQNKWGKILQINEQYLEDSANIIDANRWTIDRKSNSCDDMSESGASDVLNIEGIDNGETICIRFGSQGYGKHGTDNWYIFLFQPGCILWKFNAVFKVIKQHFDRFASCVIMLYNALKPKFDFQYFHSNPNQ